MEDQALSHNFLSAIFGIFGIFLVEICGRKNVRRKMFDRKKFRLKKYFSKNIFSRPKKILWKSQWKMTILKFRFFDEKIEIFIFHWLFHRNFFWSRKIIFRKIIFSIENFFDQTFFDENFFDHIFRLKITQRFQKSHLENCAMRPDPPSRLCVVFLLL